MLIRLQRLAQKKGARHWLDQRAFFSTNDAKDRKPIMPLLLHLFISGADQHCLNMTNAEALASTIDRGEEFARRFSDIDTLGRSEEHTSELQSLMRISYLVFSLKKKQHI